MARIRAGLLVGVALVCAMLARAAEPAIKQLYPVGAQRGVTTAVTVSGALDPWPPRVWVDAPGIVFKAEKEKGKLSVEIAADARVGPHLIRVVNADGASAPRLFMVSAEPEQLEVEPNDQFKAPQKIATLPATICGRLDKAGDVDSFAVELKRGQALTVASEAFVLGSSFDGLLRLVDPAGIELAYNHDGDSLDPFLSWTAPQDGTYIVQFMGFAYPPGSSVSFAGAEGNVYRLHFTTDPLARAALPPTDAPDDREKEPNDMIADAQTIAAPGAVAGTLDEKGDEDRFAFTGVKGQLYEVKLTPAAGSRMEPWVRVESADGKTLVRSETAARPPIALYRATDNIVYYAAVGDAARHSGPDYAYRLTVRPLPATVTPTTTSYSLTVPPGQTAELKVAVKRENGFQAKLEAAVLDLPDEINAPEVDVPDKATDVTLKFDAPPGPEPVSRPLRVVLRDKVTGAEYPVQHVLPTGAESGGIGPGDLLIESTEVLWLTVPPVAEAAPAKKP